MVDLFLFIIFSFSLFFLIKLEPLRKKVLPKNYLALEERQAEEIKKVLDKNSIYIFLLTLFLTLLLVISFFMYGKVSVWYSVWVVVFGFLYLLFKKWKRGGFYSFLSNLYLFSLKSTFIPSYIAYRLTIINLALAVTEMLSIDIVSVLGVSGSLLATSIIAGVVPTSSVKVIGEMFENFLRVLPQAQKIGFSRALTEIAGSSAEPKVREETVYHLAKYLVKEKRNLLEEGEYSYLPLVKLNDKIQMQKELSKIPKVAEVRELVKMPCFYDLKNKIIYGREVVGKKDFLVFLHIVTETAYGEGGSLHKAAVPIISENSFLIKELAKVRKEIKTDLVNLAVMQPIMENLPKEALWVNSDRLEDLNCINDGADALKTEQEERMVSLDRLEIQLTEASSINYAMPYFYSLGDIEKIERSKVADYTIFYKDGKRLEVECKYCTEKNAQVTKVEKLDIYRAWYNTMTREFTVSKVLGQGEYKEMFKITNVKEAREGVKLLTGLTKK